MELGSLNQSVGSKQQRDHAHRRDYTPSVPQLAPMANAPCPPRRASVQPPAHEVRAELRQPRFALR